MFPKLNVQFPLSSTIVQWDLFIWDLQITLNIYSVLSCRVCHPAPWFCCHVHLFMSCSLTGQAHS